MPDLSNELIAWDRPGDDPVVGPATLDRIIEAIAGLHAMPWADYRPTTPDWGWPWCPLRERLLLLSRPSAERYRADGLAVGDRFLAGWDAFDRLAPAAARDAHRAACRRTRRRCWPRSAGCRRRASTATSSSPTSRSSTTAGSALIDWQMMTLAPVAVELGWLLVSNSASSRSSPRRSWRGIARPPPGPPGRAVRLGARFADGDPAGDLVAHPAAARPERTIGDWDAQRDLTWIVGLLLRGWRKGLDAEAGAVLGSGVGAADDLAWWCGVEAAARRLGRRLP